MKRKTKSDAANGNGENSGGTNNGNPKDPNNKRAREEVPSNVEDATSLPDASMRPAPKYGTKEYWEARYKSHLPGADVMPENAEANGNGVSEDNNNDTDVEKYENTDKSEESFVLDGVVLSKEATKPGHEWYFSYDELRPLILPLILGDVDNELVESDYDEDEDSWVEEEEEGGNDEDESEKEEEGDDEDESEKEEGGDDEDESENDSDSGEDDADKEQSTCDEGTADPNHESQQLNATNENAHEAIDLMGGSDTTERKQKRVLEVGCGDKPLGTSLASDLTSMQSNTGSGEKILVEEVLCIDYSEIVVQMLIDEQKREQEQEQSTSTKDDTQEETQNGDKILPTFQALDARSLPFSSNTYDLILEKGTLDAMLSDTEEGLSNCIQIVKEMARVASEGGAILIVSHLNANEPKGMSWLEDVVFRGLKEEFLERQELKKQKRKVKKSEASGEDDEEKEYVWCVEVHGGVGQFLDANGDEIEGDPGDDAVPIFGPAVYIVRKKGVSASVAKELFSKKKEEKSAEGEVGKTKKGEKEQHEEDSGEEEGMMEMPPVKLEFLTYED